MITSNIRDLLYATLIIQGKNIETIATLNSIFIKINPSKTKYYIGETLDISGLMLTAEYSDGSSKTINSGFTVYNTTLNTAGTKDVIVEYRNKATNFNIIVETPSISITAISIGPDTITLVSSTKPDTQSIKWFTSDANIASISSSGIVTARAKGTVTITASFEYQGRTYSTTKILNIEATPS